MIVFILLRHWFIFIKYVALWFFYHILILFISLLIIYYVCLQHQYKIL